MRSGALQDMPPGTEALIAVRVPTEHVATVLDPTFFWRAAMSKTQATHQVCADCKKLKIGRAHV